MKYSRLISVMMIFCSIEILAQDNNTASTFDPGKNPASDLQHAVTEAQKTNRNILMDVGGEWCIWCHRIDAFIQGHEEIKKFLHDNYIIIKVNYSPENKNEDFLSRYPKISGYPHFFVLNKDGILLHTEDTGKLEQGKDYNPEKFMAFLEEWIPSKK